MNCTQLSREARCSSFPCSSTMLSQRYHASSRIFDNLFAKLLAQANPTHGRYIFPSVIVTNTFLPEASIPAMHETFYIPLAPQTVAAELVRRADAKHPTSIENNRRLTAHSENTDQPICIFKKTLPQQTLEQGPTPANARAGCHNPTPANARAGPDPSKR